MEQYIFMLKENGFKLTDARLFIIRSLLKVKKPLTARKIHNLLHDEGINLTSVYRNLLLFKSIGFVFEEEFKRESYYYISKKHHHHIYCEGCGFIECIPCQYDKIESSEFPSVEHNVVLKGRCKKCAVAKDS